MGRPAPVKFSVALPPELAEFIKSRSTNTNLYIKALIQSVKEGRIDESKVIYIQRT